MAVNAEVPKKAAGILQTITRVEFVAVLVSVALAIYLAYPEKSQALSNYATGAASTLIIALIAALPAQFVFRKYGDVALSRLVAITSCFFTLAGIAFLLGVSYEILRQNWQISSIVYAYAYTIATILYAFAAITAYRKPLKDQKDLWKWRIKFAAATGVAIVNAIAAINYLAVTYLSIISLLPFPDNSIFWLNIIYLNIYSIPDVVEESSWMVKRYLKRKSANTPTPAPSK